jgi:hypothetical protein
MPIPRQRPFNSMCQLRIGTGRSVDRQDLQPVPRSIPSGAPKYFEKIGRPKHPRDLPAHNRICARPGDSLYDRWEFLDKGQEFQMQVKGSLPAPVNRATSVGDFADGPSSKRNAEFREIGCRRGDSNSHGLPHHPLKTACLPVPPRRRVGVRGAAAFNTTDGGAARSLWTGSCSPQWARNSGHLQSGPKSKFQTGSDQPTARCTRLRWRRKGLLRTNRVPGDEGESNPLSGTWPCGSKR